MALFDWKRVSLPLERRVGNNQGIGFFTFFDNFEGYPTGYSEDETIGSIDLVAEEDGEFNVLHIVHDDSAGSCLTGRTDMVASQIKWFWEFRFKLDSLDAAGTAQVFWFRATAATQWAGVTVTESGGKYYPRIATRVNGGFLESSQSTRDIELDRWYTVTLGCLRSNIGGAETQQYYLFVDGQYYEQRTAASNFSSGGTEVYFGKITGQWVFNVDFWVGSLAYKDKSTYYGSLARNTADQSILLVLREGTTHAFAAGDDGVVLRSMDEGRSWTVQDNTTFENLGDNFQPGCLIYISDERFYYFRNYVTGDERCDAWETTDNGLTWNNQDTTTVGYFLPSRLLENDLILGVGEFEVDNTDADHYFMTYDTSTDQFSAGVLIALETVFEGDTRIPTEGDFYRRTRDDQLRDIVRWDAADTLNRTTWFSSDDDGATWDPADPGNQFTQWGTPGNRHIAGHPRILKVGDFLFLIGLFKNDAQTQVPNAMYYLEEETLDRLAQFFWGYGDAFSGGEGGNGDIIYGQRNSAAPTRQAAPVRVQAATANPAPDRVLDVPSAEPTAYLVMDAGCLWFYEMSLGAG